MTIPNLKRLTTEDLKPAIFEVDDTVTAGMSRTSWKIHHLLKEEGRKFLFLSGRNPSCVRMEEADISETTPPRLTSFITPVESVRIEEK
ncbi:hypothetical protein M8J76_006906 [Diaphorina citri]|nr:hypothetical protein M8J76_006906 [Diaphorina citri]